VPPRAAVVIESTAVKLTAPIPPSTSRREALAALDNISLVRCIIVTCLASAPPFTERSSVRGVGTISGTSTRTSGGGD